MPKVKRTDDIEKTWDPESQCYRDEEGNEIDDDERVGVLSDEDMERMIGHAVTKALVHVLPAMIQKAVSPLSKAVDLLAANQRSWYTHFDDCHEDVLDETRALAKAVATVGTGEVITKAADHHFQLNRPESRPAPMPMPRRSPGAGRALKAELDKAISVNGDLLRLGLPIITGLDRFSDKVNHGSTAEDLETLRKAIAEGEARLPPNASMKA